MLHIARSRQAASLAVIGIVFALIAGCAAPLPSTHECAMKGEGCDAATDPQVERGKRCPLLDTVGWVVGVPSKIVMLDRRVNNHDVSAATETAACDYLARNGLDDVKVRINEYAPGDEWKRLAHNTSVAWPVRYSLGTLCVLGYTLLPGRVFGGDQYNPYTNTINLYSDVPAIAVYEGGHAQDYATCPHKGLYAVANAVPGVNIVHETRASGDAITYLHEYGTAEEMKEGYRAIYPAFAIDATEPLESVTGIPILLPAVALGHVAGQVEAISVEKAAPPAPPPAP
jgi:hypothetical protein